jgi:hypothetical protein
MYVKGSDARQPFPYFLTPSSFLGFRPQYRTQLKPQEPRAATKSEAQQTAINVLSRSRLII